MSAQLLYLNIATLLPEFIEEKFPALDSLEVGIMFASYQIAFVLAAPLIGDKLQKFGRKRALYLSIVLFSFSTLIYAIAGFFKNVWIFFTVTIIARLIHGVADAIMQITIPAVIALEYPERIEAY